MKFRNRFLRFGRGFSLNNTVGFSNYQPTLNCFEGEDDNDSGGGGGDSGDKGGSQTVTMTTDELNALIDARVAAAGKKTPANEDKGAFDKIEKERQQEQNEKDKIAATRQTVAFDMAFNGFIEKNSRSFAISVDKFRESAKGLEGEELERTLSVTAAKDFFRSDENIDLLPQRDRDYVKSQIIGLADNAIDYRKAWQLIEDALHVKNRISENGSYRNNSRESNFDNTQTPNVTAYLEKCAAAGKNPNAA